MQIKRLVTLTLIVGAMALSGCPRLVFYTDPKLEGPEAGVKFYYSKPYLLVTRTSTTSDGKTENSVQVSVIYLPDLKNPVYAKLKTGFGSAELSLAFQNSILTSVGQKTDTKIPETITALASMATAAGGLKLRAPPPEFTLYEIKIENGKTVFEKVAFP